MTTPIFSLTRTEHKLTCGIVNIPLTYPALVYFRTNNKIETHYEDIYNVFESFHIPFYRTDNLFASTSTFTSSSKVDSKTIKQIFRNFRTLRPKLISDYRYLFWEIDSLENKDFQKVINVYRKLKLPIIVKRSMRGYHFMSIKPILASVFEQAVLELRNTNLTYPPICIRINPNKWIGENYIAREIYILSEYYHADSTKLLELIRHENYTEIQERYQLVWYNIDKVKEIEEFE